MGTEMKILHGIGNILSYRRNCMKKRILYTHNDLDGVGCYVILHSVIDKVVACGYNSLYDNISYREWAYYDNVFFTDLSIEYHPVLDDMARIFNKRFYYIDHHETSKPYLDEVKKYITWKFDITKSATRSVQNIFDSNNKYLQFSIAVDAYDMWRIETNPIEFKCGYILNVLFTVLGFDTFSERFVKNPDISLSRSEKIIVNDYIKKRDSFLQETIREEFNDEIVAFYNCSVNYINDYTIKYPDYKYYIMVWTNANNYSISIRQRNGFLHMGNLANELSKTNESILNGGGHKDAAGVTLKKDAGLEEVALIVNIICHTIKELSND